jgi:NTE family protein
VLTRLLAEKLERYEIVALSGTSGGAICALLVWYALLRNDLSVEASRMQGSVTTPLVTPYLYPEWGKEALKELLEGVVDFGEIRRLVTGSSPKLLVGAVEVRSGEFEVFRDAEVTAEKVLASCALPMMFRAVRIGDDGVYWDGLFSQNPPYKGLHEGVPRRRHQARRDMVDPDKSPPPFAEARRNHVPRTLPVRGSPKAA